MAKIIGDGPLPKKIEGYSHYKMQGVKERIMREASGFTKETIKDERYRRCGENATEFGAVTSLCKKFRDPLDGVFPVSGRRDLSNRVTSKMRSLMALDTLSPLGTRNLDVAFSFEATRQKMVGYDFNLASPLPYRSRSFIALERGGGFSSDARSFVSDLHFTDGCESVAVRMHHYLFDFNCGKGVLTSSTPLFLNRFTSLKNAYLSCVFPASNEGILFTLLELKFYGFEGGCYVPLVPDSGTVVHVLQCGESV